MLCPEVWNFPPPKVISSYIKCVDLETATKNVKRNNFYKSVIITCPDELHIPQHIEDLLLEDSDYYKISNCPLTEFLDPIFIQSFVKKGNLYGLSSDKNCITENCVALTPEGFLILHVLEPMYQTLGLEGKKCPHNYYQVEINLKNLQNIERSKIALTKLKTFNLYISWEPETENVCPSSIAKYFCDRNYNVSSHSLEVQRSSPDVKEIPTLVDTEIEEMVEWVGMLAHGADISPTEGYVSLYSQPESNKPIQSTRISILIVKGFMTPNLIAHVCKYLQEYAASRDLDNYWSSVSVQSVEDSLWQWTLGSPRMFQAQNCSCNIFFSENGCSLYSIGQLKYS